MNKQIYVIGHRNPDTDSIASAIAYAALKQRQGQRGVRAAMAGRPNPQTSYILNRLGLEPPLYLADVRPKVRDVLGRGPVTADSNQTLKEALELFHRHGIRVLPVLDEQRRPVGIVSLLKLSEKYLVAGSSRKRGVDTSLAALAATLEATFLAGVPVGEIEHLHLFIGAMIEESFSGKIVGYDPATLLIMTGDRPSIQQAAIERGVRILVVTGGFGVSDDLLARAWSAGVTVLSTPFDTATAAGLCRLSSPLSCFAEPKFESIGVAEPLEHLRLKLLHSGEPAVVALEEDGTLAGVATKSSLLRQIPYALILVDHNELGQAVPGAEAVEILEVIDHHKLGNPPTSQPITFMAAPVGSTCTVVATLYRERGIEPEPAIAALLLAGIMTDTVILKSPTTTARDHEIVAWLEPLAGLDHVTFGRDIFASCSGFSAHGSLEEAVRADFKQFSAGDVLFGIGQVEVVGFDEFFELKDALRETLRKVKQEDKLELAGLMITDIYSETTLLLAEGMNQLAHLMGYPQHEPHLYELKGVMSRKKQMVPHLLKVLGAL
ncbi:putative manganese-dependent inorganic diphosphatase [Trichlorobacter ammonificans]|uniref:inorganic diphosphatase n=1 Tax=Trichlorobacter ammonificans TaxID=2916410 RepID=A0ABM9D6R7_9BACT|nr:putative manganese-dependent inorganic diphosphatase [Trichlorobacter ammonificans]CAH2030928.1 Manganese-dependent inorganic pyrophosphatase [Trichlorobacter ammonificans]